MPVIRQQRTEFLRPAQVNRMDTGAADYAQAISRNADQLAGIAFQRAAQKAEEVGTERALGTAQSAILTINPETGRPEAFDSFTGMGEIANQAFKRIVDNRFRTEIDADLRQKSAELASQNPNPEAYASAFSSYAGGLVENADPMYREFVMTTSTEYLERTKLNLVERQRARARAASREFLGTKLEDLGYKIQEAVLAGDSELATSLEEEASGLVADGLASQVINDGEAQDYSRSIKTVFGASGLQAAIPNMTATEIVEARRYIESNKNHGSVEEGSAIAAVLDRYMDIRNKDTLLDAFNDAANQEGNYRQYFADLENQRLQDEIDQYHFELEFTAANIGDPYLSRFAELDRQIAQYERDPYATESRRYYGMLQARDQLFEKVADAAVSVEQNAWGLGTRIGRSEREDLITTSARESISSIMTMALYLNPDDSKDIVSAITESSNQSYNLLSATGRSAVDQIRRIYSKTGGDEDLINRLAGMNDNDRIDDINASRLKLSIYQQSEAISAKIAAGTASLEEINNLRSLLTSDESLSLLNVKTDIQGQLEKVDGMLASQALNDLIRNMSSDVIEDVFNAWNGEGQFPSIGRIGEQLTQISENTPPSQRGNVSDHINLLLKNARDAEAQALIDQQEEQDLNWLLTGRGVDNAENRARLEENLGPEWNPNDPNTWYEPKVLDRIAEAGILPASIYNGLVNFSNGTISTFSEQSLNVYRYLLDNPREIRVADGSKRTVFSSAVRGLPTRTRAILDSVIAVSSQSDRRPQEVLLDVISIYDDEPKMAERIRRNLGEYPDMDAFFADIAISTKGRNIYLSDRPDLAIEYMDYARYFLATTAGSPEAVQEAIARDIRSRFDSSSVVLDINAFPEAGTEALVSEYAPNLFTQPFLPNPDEVVQNYFYNLVGEELNVSKAPTVGRSLDVMSQMARGIPAFSAVNAYRATVGLSSGTMAKDSFVDRIDVRTDGYFVRVEPSSVPRTRVIYQLVEYSDDGQLIPAFIEDGNGELYNPVFDTLIHFNSEIEKNKNRSRLMTEAARAVEGFSRTDAMIGR